MNAAAVLAPPGATGTAAEEIARIDPPVAAPPYELLAALPLADEPFVPVWEEYAADAERRGAVAALRDRLPQLRFPVAAGISETPEYRAATRRGDRSAAGGGLELAAPHEVRLFLHPTPAGRIPVLKLARRDDFVAVLRALARRNEPAPIPDAQGAAIIAGYNNWDRVDRLRAAFERGELRVEGARGWNEGFAALRERRELYQDCFILLSSGPYSGVDAAAVGVDEEEWRRLSVVLRLEHECAHYFTRRVFGSMARLLDELIADYAGITAAAGRFRAEWLLRFLGLEGPAYRPGGRLENYCAGLSPAAFELAQALVRRAVRAVEGAAGPAETDDGGRARMVAALSTFTLAELAADGAADRVRERLWRLSHR